MSCKLYVPCYIFGLTCQCAHRFVFDGLPDLISYLLINEATYIKKLNNNGIQKMIRNILALQQNLSNFVPLTQCAIMENAREYYQLYSIGSEVKYMLKT